MSAYLCSNPMFARLARFAKPCPDKGIMPHMLEARGCKALAARIAGAEGDVALAYARTLQDANAASVDARYGSNDGCIDPVAAADLEAVRVDELPPVAVLKACDCLEYQSSEVDDWYTSDAKLLLDAIRERAVRMLPGYESAHWGYPRTLREVRDAAASCACA